MPQQARPSIARVLVVLAAGAAMPMASLAFSHAPNNRWHRHAALRQPARTTAALKMASTDGLDAFEAISAMSSSSAAASSADSNAASNVPASPTQQQRRQLRTVKLQLPSDSVAKKRRRKKEENVEEAVPPEEGEEKEGEGSTATMVKGPSDDGKAANPLRPTPGHTKRSIMEGGAAKGSLAGMGEEVFQTMQQNFWLGKALPAIAVGVGAGYGLKQLNIKLGAEQEQLVSSYGIEFMRYDGNQKVLMDVQNEYKKKVKGKKNKDKMMLEYMKLFLSKKPLTGASVSSIAFFVAANGLSDEDFAALCAKLCEDYMEKYNEKPVSISKVLFLADKVLGGGEAMAALAEAKEAVIKYTYRNALPNGNLEEDPEGAQKFATAQVVLAETGVRSFAAKLPEGIETVEDAKEAVAAEGRLLGVSAERCNQIFDELVAEELDAEAEDQANRDARAAAKAMNGNDDAATDPEAILKAALGEDEASAMPATPLKAGSSDALICECSVADCGYTLFVAAGREEKFFPDGFTCPECSAPKDQFNVRKQGE